MDISNKNKVNILINNKLSSAKVRIGFIAILSASLILLIYSLVLGVDNERITFISGIVLFSVYMFWAVTKPHYIYLADDSTKIIFRFYNSHPFIGKPQAIVIPKNSFGGFFVEKSFFGLRKDLFLKQITPNGEVTYPAVTISLLSAQEYSCLISYFENFKK